MGTLVKVVLKEIREYPSTAFKVVAVMALEAFCRLLGSFDFYVKKKNPFAGTSRVPQKSSPLR